MASVARAAEPLAVAAADELGALLRCAAAAAAAGAPSPPAAAGAKAAGKAKGAGRGGKGGKTASGKGAGAASRPLRVLMLHGWCQNADAFRKRLSSWRRKAARNGVELVWAEAPHQVTSAFGGEPPPDAKGWFFPELAPGAEPVSSLRASGIRYHGLDDSLLALEAATHAAARSDADAAGGVGTGARGRPPFDAWLGFSQGAMLAHQLVQAGLAHRAGLPAAASGAAPMPPSAAAAASEATSEATLPPAEFGARCSAILPPAVVMVCGIASRALTPWPADTPLPLPSLHITSPEDRSIPEELQVELMGRFRAAGRARIVHGHGHAMVQQAADIDAVIAWLRSAAPA